MKKKKVLIVDDKLEFRNLVKVFLQKKYEVATAGDGYEAIRFIIQKSIPDFIVSDLEMPRMDGKSFIKALKADNRIKHIPVIILSSVEKSNEKVELFKLGASDYMTKPFSPMELMARIERLELLESVNY